MFFQERTSKAVQRWPCRRAGPERNGFCGDEAQGEFSSPEQFHDRALAGPAPWGCKAPVGQGQVSVWGQQALGACRDVGGILLSFG